MPPLGDNVKKIVINIMIVFLLMDADLPDPRPVSKYKGTYLAKMNTMATKPNRKGKDN